MPPIRRIPDDKRRSRQGCLPCRKRRRKCGEEKPGCNNCTSRNATCVYPRHTFIFEGASAQSLVPPAADDADSPATLDLHSHSQSAAVAELGQRRLHTLASDPRQESVSRVWGNFLPSTANSVAHAPTQTAPLPHVPLSKDQPGITPPSTKSQKKPGSNTPEESKPSRSGGRAEASPLSSFVHDIVPWIVSTCPGSRFANSVIGLAESQSAVRSAMIALVQIRDSATSDPDSREAIRSGNQKLDTILEKLSQVEDTPSTRVARSLVDVARLFGSRPASWNRAPIDYHALEEGLEEPLRYLLQMQGKLELASCILAKKSPSEALISYLEQSIAAPNSSIRKAYLECLTLLAQCLHWSFHEDAHTTAVCEDQHTSQNTGLSERARTMDGAADGLAPSPSSSLLSSSSSSSPPPEWHSLWTRAVGWFAARPLEMEPIMELVGGLGAPSMGADSAASFPVEIYSTPIALQANMATHLSFMMLVAHRPARLPQLKLPRAEARFGSDSWHAQKIAGMAMWNDFKEQFDPLFVAALLLTAERMTHPCQQDALLSMLQDTEKRMGIVLEAEITWLREIWRHFRHDHR